MDIQNLTSNAAPSGGASEGTRVAVPAVGTSTPPAVPEHAAVSAKPDAATLQQAVDHINNSLKQRDSSVEFSIDKDTKRNVVKVMDSSTGEVIRQYPSEVTLAISKAIDQEMKRGVLFDQKA
jgi:flagellar protein FlaG